MYPWRRTVKVYCCPCQLRIHDVLWSLCRSAASYQQRVNLNHYNVRVLDVSIMSAIPPRMWYFSWFTVFVVRGSSGECPHLTGQGTHFWAYLLQLHISVLDKWPHSRFRDPLGPWCENLNPHPLITSPPWAPHRSHFHHIHLGPLIPESDYRPRSKERLCSMCSEKDQQQLAIQPPQGESVQVLQRGMFRLAMKVRWNLRVWDSGIIGICPYVPLPIFTISFLPNQHLNFNKRPYEFGNLFAW